MTYITNEFYIQNLHKKHKGTTINGQFIEQQNRCRCIQFAISITDRMFNFINSHIRYGVFFSTTNYEYANGNSIGK